MDSDSAAWVKRVLSAGHRIQHIHPFFIRWSVRGGYANKPPLHTLSNKKGGYLPSARFC
jgi:hypothetical protein